MFSIDNMSQRPIYEQLIEQVERYILTGLLKGEDSLPSVRSLSVELSINPNTIQKAYSELTSRGIAFSVPGKGCYVSPDAFEIISKRGRRELAVLKDTVRRLKLIKMSNEEILSAVREALLEEQ